MSVVPETVGVPSWRGEELSNPLFSDEAPECPQCGVSEALPIVYGTPSSEMVIAAQLQQIVLGGDEPEGANRRWLCMSTSCKYRF
jgi:hypothetical protein